jgi:hypothetical protein
MARQASLGRVLRALRQEEQRLERELRVLRVKIGSLAGAARGRGARRVGRTRKLSAKGRAAISRAAKKRWAAWRRKQARRG